MPDFGGSLGVSYCDINNSSPWTIVPESINSSVMRLILFFVLTLIMLGAPVPQVCAQPIDTTNRLELSQTNKPVFIGTVLQITPDPQKSLTIQNILVRYSSLYNENVSDRNNISFGLGAAPQWMSFEVTNETDETYWILKLGHLFEGRLGQMRGMKIYNASRDQIFVDALSAKDLRQAMIKGGFPVEITPGKTELMVIYLEPFKNSVAIFKPSLTPQKIAGQTAQAPQVIYRIIAVILTLACGFLMALCVLQRKWPPLMGAVYFGLNLGAIAYLQITPVALLAMNIPLLLIGASILAGVGQVRLILNSPSIEDDWRIENMLTFLTIATAASMVFVALPIGILALYQWVVLTVWIAITALSLIYIFIIYAPQAGLPAKISLMMALSWMSFITGLLVTTIELIFLRSGSGMLGMAYVYFLLPQALFMTKALIEHVRQEEHDKITAIADENQTAQDLIRLQKNKDAEDQARLLRVIEREREIMAELREKEARRTEEMRKARDEADQANAAKSAFLAVISHEIRTPMNGIMGILKLLQGTNATEEQADYILTMQKTGDTMIALLNDILDFEKIETGGMDLEHINMDLHGMINGIVMLMHGYVADKNITLSADIAPHVPHYVMGDPTRLRQVLLNLVSNAIKFTEEGGVTIKLEATPPSDTSANPHAAHDITFSVIDTGIGISEEAQVTLFDPFQQADSSVTRKYGGSGLGLTISMRLIKEMGSIINIESATGEGSRFYFTLLMEEGYGEELEGVKTMQNTLPKTTPLPLREPLATDKPLTILIIEDNETNRKVLGTMMEKEGHIIALAESGEEGLALIMQQDFDVVLMDVNLPGMSGLEVATSVRAMQGGLYQTLPLIAITGNVTEKDAQQAQDAGMNALLQKPIDYEKLAMLLQQIAEGNTPSEAPQKIKQAEAAVISEGQSAPPSKPVEQMVAKDDYDPEILQGLYDALGRDTLGDLLNECYTKIEESIGLMEESFGGKMDISFIHARMHELKGMAYNFGLKGVGDIAKEGEESARNEDADAAKAALDSLKNSHQSVRDNVEKWLGGQ